MRLAMKTDPGTTYLVFAIYWASVKGKLQRIHYVIDLDVIVDGFTAKLEDEFDVIDASIDGYFLAKSANDNDIIIHSICAPDWFFDELVNGGAPDILKKLFDRLKQLGLDHR